jgi:hypothetical protein
MASPVKESLINSQIVKARFQSAKLLQWHFLGNSGRPLDAMAHGATHFTGKSSHREKHDADRAGREHQRGNGQQVYPIDPSHDMSVERVTIARLIWIKSAARLHSFTDNRASPI